MNTVIYRLNYGLQFLSYIIYAYIDVYINGKCVRRDFETSQNASELVSEAEQQRKMCAMITAFD